MLDLRVGPALLGCMLVAGAAACSGPTEPTGSGSATESEGTGAGSTASSGAPATGTGTGTADGSGSGATDSGSTSGGSGVGTTGTGTSKGTTGGAINCEDFAGQITQDAFVKHLAAFQGHADANGGTRVSGQAGYDASAQYVFNTLEALGYDVAFEEFMFEAFLENAPSELDAVTPAAVQYARGADFQVATKSGSAEVTTVVTAVDLQLGLGNNSTSGCQAGDFGGFPAGNIALIQRGSCTFVDKVVNATAAGASAVVMFNQGDTQNRMGVFGATLDPVASIPVLFTSYATGADINGDNGGNYTLHVKVDATTTMRPTRNVLAETVAGDGTEVVMLGAHLDSVAAGAGINDDGTGSAGLLAVAETIAQCDPKKRVRFGWWAAEEWGLLGSEHHVSQLVQAELANLDRYLNFDMIGSTNYVYLVYDGDGSDEGQGGPTGSAEIEQLFRDYFTNTLSLETRPTALEGSSDYEPFRLAGVPVGGLSTGWGQLKTQAEQSVFGGQAGQQLDPCYHLACDDLDNLDLPAMHNVVRAMAFAVESYAF